MTTLSSLNSIQQQFTDLAPSSVSNKNEILGGESFEKTLDLAMSAKSLVLPAPLDLAVDTGVEILEQKGFLSTTSSEASIKDSFESVFNDLSTGIASSFAAGLAGRDSATAVTPTTQTSDLKSTNTTTTAEQTADDSPLISSQNVAEIKAAFESVAPHLSNNKAAPIANTALSALHDVLLENEEDV